MPTGGSPTLTQFLIEERRRHPDATGDLNALVTDVSLACKAISRKVAFGALADMLGHVQDNTVNVQGEEQKTLDVVKPAVGKAIEEVSATSAQIQGGAEVINPGYESELEGFWVTGIKAKISVKATGVAGRLSGSVQGTGKHLPGGDPGVPQPKDPGGIVPSNGAPASNPTPIVE